MTDPQNSSKMSLKLFIDKKDPRVLLAEAPKEFVNFLFHIFSLPLGTLIEFIGSKHMVGCLGKLKESIESFHEIYLQPGIKMDDIFNPKTAFNGNMFLLSHDPSSVDQSIAPTSVYRCDNATTWCLHCSKNGPCRSAATLHENSMCPNCRGSMYSKMTLVIPKKVAEANDHLRKKLKGRYVNEVVTYIVMDDLSVKPLTTISSIMPINKFGVKDMSQLEEKTVAFGKEEGLKLLIASLKIDKVLTKIFMD